MKVDTLTKILLFALVIFLGIIALRPLVQVKTVRAASPTGIGYMVPLPAFFTTGGVGTVFLDSRTGDIWTYSLTGPDEGDVRYVGTLTELGKPLVKRE